VPSEQTGADPADAFDAGQKQAADWLADNWDPGRTVREWRALLASASSACARSPAPTATSRSGT
jgi:hypothetical protein